MSTKQSSTLLSTKDVVTPRLAVNRPRSVEQDIRKPREARMSRKGIAASHIRNRSPTPSRQTEVLEQVGEGDPTASRKTNLSPHDRVGGHWWTMKMTPTV